MAESKFTGTMLSVHGTYGFIKQDSNEENIFVIPGACVSQRLPAIGSRVMYDAVTDQKTGRLRAERVEVEDALERMDSEAASSLLDQLCDEYATQTGGLGGDDSELFNNSGHGSSSPSSAGVAVSGGRQTGSMLSTQGKYGFIKQDSGEENMFILPLACTGFGLQLPPIGCRVSYEVAVDEKTGRPKAHDVQPLGNSQGYERGVKRPRDYPTVPMGRSVAPRYDAHHPQYSSMQASGVMHTIVGHGKFGFILEDNGGDMFVIPSTCEGGVFPPIGSRVTYTVVTDTITGRPRAEDVRCTPAWGDSRHGQFGSVQDDRWASPIGAARPRLYGPASSPPFAREPSAHQSPRVPAVSSLSPATRPLVPPTAYPALGAPQGGMPSGRPAWGRASGTMLKDTGKFGFIQQDSGEENMFVMPLACHAFGGRLPPLGTRVTYDIVVDHKTGRPRAEEVAPESTLSTGVMLSDNGKFGFIQQDSGEENMFVMPKACAALGGVMPTIGARVGYEVVLDEKTGRPRAENVHLLQW